MKFPFLGKSKDGHLHYGVEGEMTVELDTNLLVVTYFATKKYKGEKVIIIQNSKCKEPK